MKYDIQVNPYNPVEYLACCGVFEILTRFDQTATSWWEVEKQPRFWIESEIDEAELLRCLKDSLTDWSQWQKQEDDASALDSDEVGTDETANKEGDEEEGDEGIKLSPQFSMRDQSLPLVLDWWYETLSPEKKIKEKSAWKMYAGQQTAEKICRDMTIKAAELLREKPISSIADLLKLSGGMTGRFGFDPRSSRNALDTGYSANDLKLPIATYPIAELLTGFAAHYFFPTRNHPGKGIMSSRGWVANNQFQYALWTTPLPITLARMAACGAGINQAQAIPIKAERASRDKYSNFKMGTKTIWKSTK